MSFLDPATGSRTAYWGLVLRTLRCDARRQLVARVVDNDNDWRDFSLFQLRRVMAHVVPWETVPITARQQVHNTLHAFAHGTYTDPGDRGEFRQLCVASDFASWTPTMWASVGLAPVAIDPAPMQLDTATPATHPPPPPPASNFHGRPHGTSRPRLRDSMPGLRIATHNVRGLTTPTRVYALFEQWHRARLDIICLQETWIGYPSHLSPARSTTEVEHWLYDAAHRKGVPPYTVVWASNTTAPAERNGVAVLVRPSEALHVSNMGIPSACGRLLGLSVRWAGHRFHLINTYWPATTPTARRDFLRAHLGPHLARDPIMVVGDFNFTTAPLLDRHPVAASTAAEDAAVTVDWSVAAPTLIDTFRACHPTARAFTYHRGPAHARHDRIYVAPALQAYATQPSVLPTPVGDHHAMRITLLPAASLNRRGPGRVRVLSPSLLQRPRPAMHEAMFLATAATYGLSLSDEQLLDWWPTMKAQRLGLTRSLVRSELAARTQAMVAAETARRHLETAMEAVAEATPATLPYTLTTSTDAHNAYRAAMQAAVAPAAGAAHARWLHANERPSPYLTSRLRSSRHATSIPALRNIDGALLTDNAAIARRLAHHYASVSAAPTTYADATTAVLEAVSEDVRTGAAHSIPPELAHAAGEAPFTTQEVLHHLQHADKSTSPGWDGLPLPLWCAERWAELLARMFNACFVCNRLPAGFLDGTITPILKPGQPDPTQPAAYRPITLLNCDYRVLAACLATRFGKALNAAIGHEQSAFLPGRRIEDAVLFSSLLPEVAHDLAAPVALVSLDITKAYDTVSREFILAVMSRLGASAGMLRWTQLLLTGTSASVQANGVESAKVPWYAGVRQGCPLSPVLYNCAAQALASWLRAQPSLGITTTTGARCVSDHYADDSKVCLLLSVLSEAALAAPLEVFRRASGQAVSMAKSVALLVGPAPEHAPDVVAGVPVRQATISLGVGISNSPTPPQRLPSQYTTRSRLQPIPAAQQPQPPVEVLDAIMDRAGVVDACMARVCSVGLSDIGRGLAASTYVLSTALYHAEFGGLSQPLCDVAARVARRVAPGVPYTFLTCRPAEGGFGLLPFEEHIMARHVAMASRLVCRLLQPTDTWPAWVHFAAAILKTACPSLHPAQSLLAATLASATAVERGDLQLPQGVQRRCLPSGPLTHMVVALQRVGRLQLQPPDPEAAVAILHSPVASRPGADLGPDLGRLSWPSPVSGPLRPAAAPVAVRAVTAILNAPATQHRVAAHAAYIADALGAPASPDHHRSFKHALWGMWRIPCANSLKVPLWRLALDAIPGARVRPWRCPCDLHQAHDRPARLHSFWECPVAHGVRAQLQRALGMPALPRAAVWLLALPHPGIHRAVWRLVACLAIDAMEYGRRLLWARRHGPDWPDPGPAGLRVLCGGLPTDVVDTHIWPRIVAGRLEVLTAVSNLAAARFWCSLHDFAAAHAHRLPRQFEDPPVPVDHPFLVVHGGVLRARLPVEFVELA